MKFAQKVKELKKENKGKIVLVRCGIFVIATGEDAILLNKLYGLKVTCFQKNECKVGMPVGVILKYLELIEEEGYGYVLYDYGKDSKELVEKYKFEGKENSEKEECKNCKECAHYKGCTYSNINIYEILEQKRERQQKDELILIPKYEKYMQYMIETIIKMPRTEKFNIGNEFKTVMYKMLENILYINKIENSKRMYYLNLIDSELNTQRIMIRIMQKNKWIDNKKYKVSMELLYEIGKILGGLIKYYAKNNKKSV